MQRRVWGSGEYQGAQYELGDCLYALRALIDLGRRLPQTVQGSPALQLGRRSPEFGNHVRPQLSSCLVSFVRDSTRGTDRCAVRHADSAELFIHCEVQDSRHKDPVKSS